MRKRLLVLLILGALTGGVAPALAQARLSADLYPPDASAFPALSAFLDVFDPAGNFLSGLQPQDVTLFEDGQPLPVQELSEIAIPARIVVAVNPGASLGVRDGEGVSRFERIVRALNTWAQALPAEMADDLSLVTIAGPLITHAGPKDWLASLNAFRPDFRSTTPHLQSLSMAIEVASAPTPRLGMKRAVLLITPHMEDPNLEAQIQPLLQRALQNRVRIFVWFADTEAYASSPSALAFRALATQSGGAYSFAGNPPYPNPDEHFAHLRRLYVLRYASAVKQGGEHALYLEIKTPLGPVQSSTQTFTVDIQPPNPIFVQPPLQVVRRPPQDDPFNSAVLLPQAQEFEILVEFPDGHPRPLRRTRLYVDGQVVAENQSAPFEKFTWDLRPYAVSGTHKIVAEAEDALGLSKTSIEIPLTLTVIQPARGAAALFARYREFVTWGAVGFSGLALLLILFMGSLRSLAARRQARRRAQSDPLTQPLEAILQAAQAEKKMPRGRRRPPAPHPSRTVDAPAYLRRILPDASADAPAFKPSTGPFIPLLEEEITLGSDPVRAMHVLDHPSIAALHARLKRSGDSYLLTDADSVAGTWVNFEAIGKEGHLLQHGDVIHFGALAFRFERRGVPEAEPMIVHLD